MDDPYKVLGVRRDDSDETIRSAYRKLAKRYHPDRGNQQTHELMANINAARTAILKCRRVV